MSLASSLEHARDQFLHYFGDFAFSRALESAWAIIARVDKMLSDAKPWDLAKQDDQRETLNAVLYRAAETLRWLCVLLYPAMPEATQTIYGQLGLTAGGDPASIDPTKLEWGTLEEGTRIGEVKAVFPRIDRAKTMTATIENREPSNTGVHATEADAVAGSPTGLRRQRRRLR